MARKVENKHWFDFQYEVVNREADYAIIHMGAATVSLSDRELGLVAEALQRHGGLDVGLRDIPWLDDIAGGNIHSDGERLCHTSTLTVLRCERVPEGLLPTFQDGRGKTHRQAGYDVRPGRDGVEQAITDLLAPLSAESKG